MLKARPITNEEIVVPNTTVRTLTKSPVATTAFDQSSAKWGGKSPLLTKSAAEVKSADDPVDLGEMVIVGRPPSTKKPASPAKIVLAVGATAVAMYLLFR